MASPDIIQDYMSDCYVVSWAWMHTKHSFDSKATWVIDVLGIVFNMLAMTVCTNRHWQTGRLVQELNAGTVAVCVPIARVGSQSGQGDI